MTAQLHLPSFPSHEPRAHAVLFGFDTWAFPFREHLTLHLVPGQNPQMVLPAGPAGAHDEVVLYYGTVIRIEDTFHLWYYGSYGPPRHAIGYGHGRPQCCLCYATSQDGLHWHKPDLGLVTFNGSRQNNIVDFPEPAPRPAAVILYEPDEVRADRRFKMAYEASVDGKARFCVAFSADGLHWTLSERNPVGPFLEMSGVARFGNLYYVTGQASLTAHRPFRSRQLFTFASADFEHWSPCGAMGLDRTESHDSPATEADWNHHEEIHLGAGLWNRGNVLLGIYGQWHGHPSGDRRLVTMDLGLALSHDAIHYSEPIPGFRFIAAREQPESPFDFPALMQGQGMVNVGDRTLYWYSLWRGTEGTGVRAVHWQRDRLGYLQPYRTADVRAISCPVQVVEGSAQVHVNVSGLGEHAFLRIHLLSEGFEPLPLYSGEHGAEIRTDGLYVPVIWGGETALPLQSRVRLSVEFCGVRPEDIHLYALYVGDEPYLSRIQACAV
jgi:hypothetical protein